MANVPKTQFFAPKMELPNPKWKKPPKGTSSSQDLPWVKIWALSSKCIKRYGKYTKNVFFCPKIKSGWLFFITGILHTQHLHSVKIWSSNSNQQPRYSYMNIWGKKQCFCPKIFLGWFFLLKGGRQDEKIHHIATLPNQLSSLPLSYLIVYVTMKQTVRWR